MRMSHEAKIDLASTGGARGGKLALDIAAQSCSPAAAAAARIIQTHQDRPGALLPMLHAIQDELGHIPEDSIALIAAALQRSRAEVYGVITFYPHFRLQPVQGRHLEICRAEACQARGAQTLIDHAQRTLGCGLGQTSADGSITADPVYCLGLCAQGPAVMLDGQPHAHVTPARLDTLLAEDATLASEEVR
ncbi:formate dehydrogenase subunit gamma [Alcaligenaceae bacterium SJ-26]|nr:formate dehydrogenase subunit gamma [Alcaligenaceae bacterium SJ-26]